MNTNKNILSSGAIVLVFIIILSVFQYYDLWKQNRITLDVPSYYTYLPAAVIHRDLQLNFIDANPQHYEDKIWYYRIENGKKLIKHPMGLSVALSPFFVTGHLIAKISNATEDGYSLPYQNAVTVGVFIYLFIGLFFLRKLLLQYFPDEITALTLLSLVLATNLLWYSTFEILMPHAVSFSLVCISLYTFMNWLRSRENKYLFAFALAFGLSVLIRQLAVTFLIFFVMAGIISKGGIKSFWEFLKPAFPKIIIAALISIAIASLQIFYWKYITGSWFYDPYAGEHFVFFENKMLSFLFGFRKGFFIYSPIFIFFIIGLVYFYKHNKALFYSTITLFLFSVFIFSSWWAWSYGISWGLRPMIDYYPVLSLSLAAGFSYFYNKRILKTFLLTVITLFIILNLFQTWQYKNGLIHYDDMTRDAYFKGFFQSEASLEWHDRLQPYDWNRRRSGLSQINYSKELILNTQNGFNITGSNLLYLSVNPRAQNAVAAYMGNIGANEMFYIEQLNADTIIIRATNGNLFSVRNEYDNIITASAHVAGQSEKFLLEYIHEGNNLIALKSLNGNYISVNENYPYTLHANKSVRGRNETFRIYLTE